MYQLIFAICLFIVTNSNAELGYSIDDERTTNTASQSNFYVPVDIEVNSDTDFEPSITSFDVNNVTIPPRYLSNYSTNNNLIILKNKFQYSRPRAPPFFIV